MHAAGGNLNPHLDYSIHPKMGLQRKLNVIIYLFTQPANIYRKSLAAHVVHSLDVYRTEKEK